MLIQAFHLNDVLLQIEVIETPSIELVRSKTVQNQANPRNNFPRFGVERAILNKS